MLSEVYFSETDRRPINGLGLFTTNAQNFAVLGPDIGVESQKRVFIFIFGPDIGVESKKGECWVRTLQLLVLT